MCESFIFIVEFDPDDPLAGLLSDEDDIIHKKKKNEKKGLFARRNSQESNSKSKIKPDMDIFEPKENSHSKIIGFFTITS